MSGAPNPFSIRASVPGDAEAIAAVLNEAIANSHAHFGESPTNAQEQRRLMEKAGAHYPWLSGVSESGEVMGFAKAAAWNTREAYRWTAQVSVYLAPVARGQRLGSRLYAELFRILEAQGYRTIIGGVARPNDASERLHLAMGMDLAGVLPATGYKLGAWRDVAYYVRRFGSGEPGVVRTLADVPTAS